MKIYQPLLTKQALTMIKKDHLKSGQLNYENDLEFKEFIYDLVERKENEIESFSKELNNKRVRDLSIYAPNNYYSVDVTNVYEVLRYRMDSKNFRCLYGQWTRNYKDDSCCNFLNNLLRINENCSRYLRRYQLDEETFENWLDSSNTAREVAISCGAGQIQSKQELKERLHAYGIAESSGLGMDTIGYYYLICSRQEYLAGKQGLVEVVKRYKNCPEDLWQFLLNFLPKFSQKELAEFGNLAEVCIQVIGEAGTEEYQEFFSEELASYEKKFRVWINNTRIEKVFKEDERSMFWKRYSSSAVRVGYHSMSNSLTLLFDNYCIIEFMDMGYAYLYKRDYYEAEIERKLSLFKSQDMRSRLYNNTYNEERWMHQPGKWMPKAVVTLTKYCIYADYLEDIYRIVPEKVKKQQIVPSNEELPQYEIKKSEDEIFYKRLEEPDCLIKADIHEKMIVNAGPGTGKTYSVIERLTYLVFNEEIDLSNIMVICFSRNAAKLIRDRLQEKIDTGHIDANAEVLMNNIRTLDSLATWALSGDNTIELSGLSYDQRIRLFISELHKEPSYLSDVEYLIIDEMQDIVGVRARMVIEILRSVSCGFLLLGDKCQAIYEFRAKQTHEMTSVQFYSWLEGSYEGEASFYEFCKNRRQTDGIASYTASLREAMLQHDIEKENQKVQEFYDRFGRTLLCFEQKIGEVLNSGDGILCRNNKEAVYISNKLTTWNILNNRWNGREQVSFRKEIALILSEYKEEFITYKRFQQLKEEQGIEDDNLWDYIHEIAGKEANVLGIADIRDSLKNVKNVPIELYSSENNQLCVSTIHRAKGQEFDRVLLLENDFQKKTTRMINNEDEMKVLYVAMTRAKNQVSFLEVDKINIRTVKKNKRWAQRENVGDRWSVTKITSINVLPEDVQTDSFICRNAVEKQGIISKIQRGEKVELYLKADGKYAIYYQDKQIGKMKASFSAAVQEAINGKQSTYPLPERMTEVYISNIVTIVRTNITEEMELPYKQSGFWLGVELTGFAKMRWERKAYGKL